MACSLLWWAVVFVCARALWRMTARQSIYVFSFSFLINPLPPPPSPLPSPSCTSTRSSSYSPAHPAAMPASNCSGAPPPVPRATAPSTCAPSPWQAMTMCCVRCLVHLGRQWQWECAAVLPDPWCDVLHCSVLWCAARCCWWRHGPLCAVLQCLWCAMVCGVLHFSVVRCVCCTLCVLGCAAQSCRSNSVLCCAATLVVVLCALY